MSVEQILANMKESCEKEGFYATKNIEKIARAKNMMFGLAEWQRCPCDGNNPDRYCGSELCRSDVKNFGICHCNCYSLKPEDSESK